jgi:uncharacterized membrane protein
VTDKRSALLAAGCLAIYALLAHYTSATPGVGAWAIVPACAPMLVLGFGIARASAPGLLLWLAGLAACALLAWFWPRLSSPVAWLYFLQHIGINGSLGLLFGRTLSAGRRPLCTEFAHVMHRQVSPALARYTRQLTVAWTLLFAAIVALSALLFLLAPIEIWSVFANILTLPLVGLMFIAQGEIAKRLLGPDEQIGILAAMRAFRTTFRS